MSLRFALLDLNPRMRAQAEERLAALPRRTVSLGIKPPPRPDVTLLSRVNCDNPPKPSVVELLVWQIQHVCNLPAPIREHRFHPTRKWRFDLAWPDRRLAIEIDGVTYEGGRHQRIEGFTKDLHKHNAATLLNWRVLYMTPKMARSAECLDLIERTYG